jgi:aldehyde oxidoreductase
MIKKTLNVNGVEKVVITEPNARLVNILRDNPFLTDTKINCRRGDCGACSIILNGKVVRSCTVKMKHVPEFALITKLNPAV